MQVKSLSELEKEAREIIESAVLVAPETAAETLAHQVASDREHRAFVAELQRVVLYAVCRSCFESGAVTERVEAKILQSHEPRG